MEWKTKLAEKSKPLTDFLFFLAKRAQNDMIFRVASSLAYTSLIALVPLFAIGLAIFSAFPVFEAVRSQVEEFIFQNLTPEFEQEVSSYFAAIVKNAGQLTTIGVVGIAVTSILLLSTIENSFNFIFKVTQPRHITTKITLYWTVITLGPLLLGTAFSMRGYLYTLQKFMAADGETGRFFFSCMIPPLMTILSLMLVYVLVPNKKVRLDSALAGAAVAVVLFWFLRQGFSDLDVPVLGGGHFRRGGNRGFGRVSSVQRQGNKKGNRCRQIRPALTFGVFHGQTRRRFFRPFKRQNPAKRGVFVLVVSFKVTPFAAFPEFRRIPHTCRNNSGSGKGRCCPATLPPPLCPASWRQDKRQQICDRRNG